MHRFNCSACCCAGDADLDGIVAQLMPVSHNVGAETRISGVT